MKPEDKVCTLEQAKRLAELKVKREAGKFWFCPTGGKIRLINGTGSGPVDYPAYDVAELGEMLPKLLPNQPLFDGHIEMRNFQGCWHLKYTNIVRFIHKGEAHIRADMLIWLLENNHITTKELNGDSE